MRKGILSVGLTVISRMLIYGDKMTGKTKPLLVTSALDTERFVIPSGDRALSAASVSAGEGAPIFLICHGIGERLEYWGGVQTLLKSLGVSSLIFNYSGYGSSSGSVSAAHCEEDAIAAHQQLANQGHHSIFLLGFSLGSGVVSAVASTLEISGVILCEGFSTLREAAVSTGLPRWMTYAIPNIWKTVHQVREPGVPILVVHSDADRLFPLSMATQVAEACGQRGQLIVINGLSHNAPIFAPTPAYWSPIAEWAKQKSCSAIAEESQIVSDQSALSG